MEKQRTLETETHIEGVGLHTGNVTRATFKPAPEGFGIRFVRLDIPGKPLIPADVSHVLGITRGTTIGSGSARVHTVEHMLAACAGLGIDNLEVHLTNNEPPVLDGSAKPFVELFLKAGIRQQNAPRTCYRLQQPVVYESGGTKITAQPADNFSIDCTIGYKHPALAHQQASFVLSSESFAAEIAPARTFCFDFEIEALKNKGLAKGGDFSNAIVIGLNGIHNPGKTLRFADEFVRHKMLDIIGDLYLLGKPLKAHIITEKPGHVHNINFAKELLKVAIAQ